MKDRIHPVFNNSSGRVWRLRSVPSSDPRWRCQLGRRAKSKSPRGDIELRKSSGELRDTYTGCIINILLIYIYTQGLTFWCCHSWLEPMYLCMLSKDQWNTQCRISCWWVAAVSHACLFSYCVGDRSFCHDEWKCSYLPSPISQSCHFLKSKFCEHMWTSC